MVYKLCCYIDKILNKNEASKFVDLVALGLIADMMDLRSFEVRELIIEGLKCLHNPYFKEMVS